LAARAADTPSTAGDDAPADPGPRLGVRRDAGLERRGHLHPLPARQDRPGARSKADPHGALGRLRAAAMIFGRVRRRLLATNVVAMAIVIGALGTGVVILMDDQLMAQEQSTLVSDARRIDPHDVMRITYG